MQKVILIFFLSVFFTGCSVIKKSSIGKEGISNDYLNGKSVEEKLYENNISNSNYFIQKAEIEINNGSIFQSFLTSIKFESPQKYLISVKSKSGIEGLRIFLTKDTILINDRINKKMFYGSPDYLQRKYGISYSLIPLLIGDFVSDIRMNTEMSNCKEDKLSIIEAINGFKLKYLVDCKRGKSLVTIVESNIQNKGVELKYNKFFTVGNKTRPTEILLNDINRKLKVKIRISKIEIPWVGQIDFIPGSGYEILQLL